MTNGKGKLLAWSMLAAVVVGGLIASLLWGPLVYAKITRPKAEAKPRAVEVFTVKRGELRVVFVESGKLRAVKNHSIFPQISRQSLKITWLAPEGASVKKGDPVASFEKKNFEDQLQTKKGELDTAKRSLTVAEAGLKIQKSTGTSTVALAQTKLGDAEVALRTYVDLEAPKKITDLESLLNETRTKLTDSTKKVQEAQQRLDDELFVEDDQRKTLEREISNAKEAVRTLQKNVEGLLLQRKIFRAYDYPQTLATKKAAVTNAQLELEKSKVSAENEINQKEAEVFKVTDALTRLNREVEQLTDNIKKCDLTAPVDGLVLYGDPNQPWRQNEVKIGQEWYGGNVLMTIPDLSSFEIDIGIAEEYRGKVKPGLRTSVTLEAVPGLQIVGTLREISKLGKPRIPWDNTAPRVFESKVALEAADPRMVSGMSARVEIVADSVADVLMVPIDSVTNDDGKTYCMVKSPNGPEKRLVKTERSNENFVEITSGLNEGEIVWLVPVVEMAEAK